MMPVMFRWCIFNHKLATDITKTVRRVHTTTTWHVQSTTQYKIKLRLKNEKALSASLEQEEVMSHSLLDLLSTTMLVQKIATKGANSVYPYTWRKYLCTDVYWIKNCDSIELFYIRIQYEMCTLTQYKHFILWKNGTWYATVSAILYFSTQKYMKNRWMAKNNKCINPSMYWLTFKKMHGPKCKNVKSYIFQKTFLVAGLCNH
jgi:hypothetical protein